MNFKISSRCFTFQLPHHYQEILRLKCHLHFILRKFFCEFWINCSSILSIFIVLSRYLQISSTLSTLQTTNLFSLIFLRGIFKVLVILVVTVFLKLNLCFAVTVNTQPWSIQSTDTFPPLFLLDRDILDTPIDRHLHADCG